MSSSSIDVYERLLTGHQSTSRRRTAPARRSESVFATNQLDGVRPLQEILKSLDLKNIQFNMHIERGVFMSDGVAFTCNNEDYVAEITNKSLVEVYLGTESVASCRISVQSGPGPAAIFIDNLVVDRFGEHQCAWSPMIVVALYAVMLYRDLALKPWRLPISARVKSFLPQAVLRGYEKAAEQLGYEHWSIDIATNAAVYESEFWRYVMAGGDEDQFSRPVFDTVVSFQYNQPVSVAPPQNSKFPPFETVQLAGLPSLRSLMEKRGARNIQFKESENPIAELWIYDIGFDLGGVRYHLFNNIGFNTVEREEDESKAAECSVVVNDDGELDILHVKVNEKERGKGLCVIMVLCSLYSAVVVRHVRRQQRNEPVNVRLFDRIRVEVVSNMPASASACYTAAAYLLGATKTTTTDVRYDLYGTDVEPPFLKLKASAEDFQREYAKFRMQNDVAVFPYTAYHATLLFTDFVTPT